MRYLLIAFIFLNSIQLTFAQEPQWLSKIKKIVPISSTEKNVEKLFGKPKERTLQFAEYETPFGHLTIEYSIGECKSNSSDYSVSKGTVVGIDFSLKKEFYFNKLKLDLSKFTKEDSDDTENITYKNPMIGITYSIYVKKVKGTKYDQRPKILSIVSIYPSSKYKNLRCSSQ